MVQRIQRLQRHYGEGLPPRSRLLQLELHYCYLHTTHTLTKRKKARVPALYQKCNLYLRKNTRVSQTAMPKIVNLAIIRTKYIMRQIITRNNIIKSECKISEILQICIKECTLYMEPLTFFVTSQKQFQRNRNNLTKRLLRVASQLLVISILFTKITSWVVTAIDIHWPTEIKCSCYFPLLKNSCVSPPLGSVSK